MMYKDIFRLTYQFCDLTRFDSTFSLTLSNHDIFTGYDTAVGERGMKLSGGESESPGIISADECEGYLWIS